MRVESTHTQIVDSIDYFCDWCGKKVDPYPWFGGVAACVICGRHTCSEHAANWHEMNTGSDYEEEFCHECWEIGKPYRDRIGQLEDEVEALQQDWYAVAKQSVSTTKSGELNDSTALD